MTKRTFVVLISTLLITLSSLSNVNISYALDDTKTESLDSSYYLIHYNGQDNLVEINDKVTLTLNGWADEVKSSVNATIKIDSDSTNVVKPLTMEVSDTLNEILVTDTESQRYRIVINDTFNASKVTPLELSENKNIVEQNENGTFIEERITIDEYGTVIENKGLAYYTTNENNQKVEITKEEYDSFTTEVTNTEPNSTTDQLPVSEETSNSVDNSIAQQNIALNSASPSVVYSTHVQSHGWLDDVSDGNMSGTSGESKRMEAIKISLQSAPYTGDITYKTHVQSHGWLNNVTNGAESGTSGEKKRLEAIQINLTGDMALHYDIYYRVHAQSYGWLDWGKNGQSVGTQGLSKRLEAIEIVLVKKGGAAPGATNKPFVLDPSVVYSTHVQSYGWLPSVSNGQLSGTSGESKRMEALKISLKNAPYSGDISYKTHVQSYGWLNNVSNGALSGTSGEGKRLEAIQINLTGEMATHYDIYYRVHAQSYGWLDWAKNGQSAGTQGLTKRLEAIEIILVEKGKAPPGSTQKPFVLDPSVVYSTHVQSYGWINQVSDGAMSGTLGKSKQIEAIKINLENAPYPGGISYKTLVQDYGWLNNAANGSVSGTSGENKRVEAIQINLNGEMAKHYDIYYRVHAQTHGWLDWAKNGQSAGTQYLSKRLEAIEIVLVEKGGTAPGVTNKPFIQPSIVITNNTYDLSLTDALNMQMNVYPQTDKYRNSPAYISSRNISVYDGGSIIGSSVNLRTSPHVNRTDNIADTVGYGTAFLVLNKNVTGDLVAGSTKWYEIEYNGKRLYVHSSLSNILSRVGKITSDKAPILADKNNNSHIYGTVSKGALLTILEEDNIGWHKVSIGNWRNAMSSDVQVYLNPLNYINDEKQRLQFMNLSKPSDVSVETLNKYLTGKGILANQGQAFIDSGNLYGINEVYLMAHTMLETGNGTSPLAKGIMYNGKTVYNMYGVGAYDNCPVECGAKFAYEKGWFTPYHAIVGGAAYISDKYLGGNNPYNVVQNTLYEMRWNPQVMATHKRAGNQYATDIGWATKQVNTMYEVYKIQPFTIYLEIPKFK